MTLRQGEYEITDDAITIKKVVLEQWREHYAEVSQKCSDDGNGFLAWFYTGKRDVLVDLLKMFEPLEGL